MSSKLLQVKDLSISFGAGPDLVRAVDGLSFDLRPGETLGIVGESGSGKSMTALAIMGLLPAAAQWKRGEVLFTTNENETVHLNTLSAGRRRPFNGAQLGMVFQEPMSSLNPVFTCGDQVAEALRHHRRLSATEARAFTTRLFEKVRLPEPGRIYRSYPHQLSGGQKQRVMIAMALSCGPQLIICDEPTTALDVSIQKGILELLNDLKGEGRAGFLFISHDLGVIAEVADRVLVMYRGEKVEMGPVSEIFLQPQHPYTKGLIACRPRLDMTSRRLPVLSDFMGAEKDDAPVVKEEGASILKGGKAADSGDALLLLQVNDLKVWYPGAGGSFGKKSTPVKAVDGLSFEVREGEILGVVGESGSGKTTLGKAIVRLAPITGGEIFFEGRPVHHMEGKERKELYKKVQMIFQDPYGSLNPRMRVGEAIMEPMQTFLLHENAGERRRRAKDLLDLVQLPASAFDRYPHEFSGGQRQRVGIARALAVEPSLLICDESVSSLDVSIQAQILNLLLDLREELGLTYLFISHDLSVVKFFSDRLLVMKDGRIVEAGTPEAIYRSPQTEYTRRLIAAIPEVGFGG